MSLSPMSIDIKVYTPLSLFIILLGCLKLSAQPTTEPSPIDPQIWSTIGKILGQEGFESAFPKLVKRLENYCGNGFDCQYSIYHKLMLGQEEQFNLSAAIQIGEKIAQIARISESWDAEGSAYTDLSRYYGALGNQKLAILNEEKALACLKNPVTKVPYCSHNPINWRVALPTKG